MSDSATEPQETVTLPQGAWGAIGRLLTGLPGMAWGATPGHAIASMLNLVGSVQAVPVEPLVSEKEAE